MRVRKPPLRKDEMDLPLRLVEDDERPTPKIRKKDEAWDALVEVTHANPAMEKGKLGVALRAIREACLREGIHADSVPAEIRLRADAYGRTFPGLTITPTALATHWFRVLVGQPRTQQQLIDELKGRA